ncbi:MAG TPA: glyoxylate/hydroxypyruvate reductase A [Rhizobacter sp.]|nr:glyoxylate/hydroxypyruvate reductase A [Rhizobacter sp.]
MAILVLSAPLRSAPFAAALHQVAPDIPVWTEQDQPPPDAVEAILAWRMPAGVLPAYPKLRVLCSTGAGVDKLIDAPDLPPDLPVTRVVDPVQAQEIAQYVVACTLRFTRDFALYAEQQAQALWRRHPVREASQCRIGVLGMGAVGQAIARVFVPLGYPVGGWSRTPHLVPGVAGFAGADELPQFLSQADVLVCALPLTTHTRGLLNHHTLSQLPRGAWVINVGHGEHLVEPDLHALLDGGYLAGAALDVFEREPAAADHWIWSHPRVLATPHIASQASFETVARQCVEALHWARAGLAQPRAVNRAAGY